MQQGVPQIMIVINGRSITFPVLPQGERAWTVHAVHQQAYFGFNKTLEQVRCTSYWSGMTSDIRR